MANDAFQLNIDLADKGGLLVFKSPSELSNWLASERGKWGWLKLKDKDSNFRRPFYSLLEEQNGFLTSLQNEADQWSAQLKTSADLAGMPSRIKAIIENYCQQRKGLVSSDPSAIFVLQLKEKRGDIVAIGAYAAMVNFNFSQMDVCPIGFLEGVVEAVLFKRGSAWEDSVYRSELDRLKNQFAADLVEQERRFGELDKSVQKLHLDYQLTYNENVKSLQKLHEDQSKEFLEAVKRHQQEIENIETVYNQKLSLMAPVQYWADKEKRHKDSSYIWGWVAIIIGGIIAGVASVSIYKILIKLGPNETPQSWQLGVLGVGAFFAAWLIRVLVRLFLSHLHLATDAAERKIMIETFLAMSRQGSEFTSEDKKLITQHIFRSVSDGLVKDDAAPPTLFGMITGR